MINVHEYQSGRYLQTSVAYSYEEAELYAEDLSTRGIEVCLVEDLDTITDLDYPEVH